MYCVISEEQQQLERLKLRNGFTDEHARQRITSQMPLHEKCTLADYVIDNSGSRENTEAQVHLGEIMFFTFCHFECLIF